MRSPRQPVATPLVLLGVVIFQGLLGMWTVTLLLKPLIVMGHLLGGLTTLALLTWLLLEDRRRNADRQPRTVCWPVVAGLLVLIGLVVGVLEGILEERSYVRLSPDRGADTDIELVRGGVILLGRGAVTSFVPNPDHIHITGVPLERPRAVSLHLYGRNMNSFHVYDVAHGTRKLVQLPQES